VPLNPEAAKRLELLRETIPQIGRVAMLRNPSNSGSVFVVAATEMAAQQLGIQIQVLTPRTPEELEPAFRAAAKERARVLMIVSDNLFFSQPRRLADLGVSYRLPVMFDTPDFVDAGGLMSYGADLVDLFRRSAAYVDKIIKGASPADLPVEQATKFELVVNLQAATHRPDDPTLDRRPGGSGRGMSPLRVRITAPA